EVSGSAVARPPRPTVAPCSGCQAQMEIVTIARSAPMKNKLAFASLLGVGSLLAAPAIAQQPPSPAGTQPVIYLDQAWSQGDREWYYNFSQGSAVIAYDIFLNLEVPGGQDLFRSDGNLVRYGLIPTAANQYNPDALPIGISKTLVATTVRGWPA